MLENTGQRRQIKNTDNTVTKHYPEKSKQRKKQQNKTTLVWSHFTTFADSAKKQAGPHPDIHDKLQ